MPQPLRVVDNERLHPRDAARAAVKKFRLDRERERLPICNQSTGAKNLFIDEVLKRTERAMQEELRPRYHVNAELLIKTILLAAGLIGVVKLIISIV